MRVIAGEFRSRKLLSIEGFTTRPTSDRLRETLFNIIRGDVEDAIFVDAYAGTGAVGIEALSRGARHAVFIEKHRDAVEVIRQNLENLKLLQRSTVIKGAVALRIGEQEGNIVFLDPPFEKEREYDLTLEILQQRPPGLVIVQHSVRFRLAEQYGGLFRTRQLKQGENALSFYRTN